MSSIPTFAPYPSILNSTGHLFKAAAPDGTCAVAVPKLHGSNISYTVWTEDGEIAVVVGRRNGYVEAGGAHYGHTVADAAQQITPQLKQLYKRLAAPNAVLRVYGEVYGGHYPDVPTHNCKPVQRGIWYNATIRIAFFDMCLTTGDVEHWYSFDDASCMCKHFHLPWVPAAFRGSVAQTVAWARSHAADGALMYWNPDGLPMVDKNEGEGFVVRLVGPHHELAKIKNPRFEEIAVGKTTSVTATTAAASKSAEFAATFILPARAAAVASKVSEAELDGAFKNGGLRKLVEALLEDALKDAATDVFDAETIAGARKAAYATMVAYLKSR